jgi:hypothetical protein
MDYLTRRSVCRQYGVMPSRVAGGDPFPLLYAAGPRRVGSFVPRKEVVQALEDIGLADLIAKLPLSPLLDAGAVERILESTGLSASEIKQRSEDFFLRLTRKVAHGNGVEFARSKDRPRKVDF